MSRKYLNDKWCVRCGRTTPTPYLLKNSKLINGDEIKKLPAIDCGCGNGRNTFYLKSIGFQKIHSLDMAGDFGEKCALGKDKIPLKNNVAGLILANYIYMFLNKEERANLTFEILRVAKKGCYLMVELYPAKDSHLKTEEETIDFQQKLYNDFVSRGWKKIKYSKQRFVIEKII